MGAVIAIPQMGKDLFRIYMKSKYTRSLARAGAKNRWIGLNDPVRAVEEALECDGLLLPGGADIDPALYGQKADETCGKPNPMRDAVEPVILEKFLETGKPIFCICRGVQLLNICRGGTLYQNIKAAQAYDHSDFRSRAYTTHPISVEKDSKLHRILGADTVDVNSIHHQATDQVGKGLVVTARSTDGFIEGLELEGHPFCLGVQWHPEHMSRRYPAQQALFNAFVAACG